MTFRLLRVHRHRTEHEQCEARIGNDVVCGRRTTPGEEFCDFHRTLEGPWFRAACK